MYEILVVKYNKCLYEIRIVGVLQKKTNFKCDCKNTMMIDFLRSMYIYSIEEIQKKDGSYHVDMNSDFPRIPHKTRKFSQILKQANDDLSKQVYCETCSKDKSLYHNFYKEINKKTLNVEDVITSEYIARLEVEDFLSERA